MSEAEANPTDNTREDSPEWRSHRNPSTASNPRPAKYRVNDQVWLRGSTREDGVFPMKVSRMDSNDVDRMEKGEVNYENTHHIKSENNLNIESPQPSPSSTVNNSTLRDSENDESVKSSSALGSLLKRISRRFSFSATVKHDLSMYKIRKFRDCRDGYPNLAAFLDSDENFMLYRRFGYIQARLLLSKQDQLRALEEDLDKVDKDDDDVFLVSRDRDEKANTKRYQLLQQIETIAELLSIAQNLAAMSKPAARDYESVKNFFDNKAPVCEEEEYIRFKEDMITLKPGRENAWLDAAIEKALQKCPYTSIQNLFSSPELRDKADKETNLYSKSRIDAVVTCINALVILLLLVVPIYTLWHLSKEIDDATTTALTIGVLLICTLIFSAVLSLFTKARRHEILAAAAAYCAVLVVFMSNVGNQRSNNSI
ncbi:hypothetical protein B7463_g2216, partial [Scytalidium lignicola]